MDWESIDKITTSGNNKNPYWQEDIRYNLDDEKIREWKRIERYKVQVLINDSNYQDVSLSQSEWENLRVGWECLIQKPRWVPISKEDVVKISQWCNF